MSTSLEVGTQNIPGRAPLSFAGRCRFVLVSVAVVLAMAVAMVVMLLVGIVTFFQARRLYAAMAKRLGRLALWLNGVKLVVHPPCPSFVREGEIAPAGQVVYISNHTSTLDCFILIALGLPNTRFFLSGFLRKNPLIGVMGTMMGTFWTVPQIFPQKRAQIFQRAERVLRRTGESVYLSPEGERIRTGLIGHFNKGSFHLATNLQAPLVPFYIAIPPETDPGMGIEVRPGVVHVYFQPAISTQGWRLEDLEQNRTTVRDVFVRLHEELKIS